MCGRFSQTKQADELATTFRLATTPDWQPRYNLAPTQLVPALVQAEGSPWQFEKLRWGLIPSWSKDKAIGARLINARAETVAEKPAFRSAFRQRRCLILADGFFEWQKQAKGKQPFYFRQPSGQSFAFAGLWESWKDEEKVIHSCTILTTDANHLMTSVHNRMPVIIHPADYETWIAPTTTPDVLHSLLQPIADDFLESYPVSPVVNTPKNDAPACIEPVAIR